MPPPPAPDCIQPPTDGCVDIGPERLLRPWLEEEGGAREVPRANLVVAQGKLATCKKLRSTDILCSMGWGNAVQIVLRVCVSLGFLCIGTAAAQAPPSPDVPMAGWGASVTLENDMFLAGDDTDRYYTQGGKITWLSPEASRQPLDDFFRGLGLDLDDDEEARVRTAISIGQQMYTPENKTTFEPDPKDRPYAGWLYAGLGATTYSPTQLNTLELQVGIVGPSARQGELQNRWHELIKAARVNGWNNQLHDELGINLFAERRYAPVVLAKLENGEPWFDVTQSVNAAFGNVEISGGLGATFRVGHGLDGDFGHARLRAGGSTAEFVPTEGWSLYGFTGIFGRAVARDIFLDGNTFRDSQSVEKRWFVPEFTAGVVGRWKRWRLSYTYVVRDEEFLGQNGPQEFGAWTFTWTSKTEKRATRP